MVDSTKLLAGLLEYYADLDRHLTLLQADFQQLENRWQAFNAVYEGEAAQQFQISWLRTAQWFQDYINQTQKLMAILDQRILALQEANLSGGGLR